MKTSFSSPFFSSALSQSKTIKTPHIVFRVHADTERPCFKLGFFLKKSLGPANKRNLFKRRSRALFDELFIKKNYKICIIIRPKTINLGWKQIVRSFNLLTKNLNDF